MKTHSASLIAASLLSITAAIPAHAGSIETPMLYLSSTTKQLICIATNASNSSINVRVKIIGNLGGTATENCILPAGDINGCSTFLENNAGRCRISVNGMLSNDVRERVRGVLFTRNAPSPSTIEAVVEAR